MKFFQVLIVFGLLLPLRSWGATITAVSNGSWTANSTWSCNCQPSSSDNIVIPAGRTVTASGPVILFLGPVINITIGGILVLNNGSLQIDSSDVVNILSGGEIKGTGLLGGSVYSGVMPIFIPNGSTIDGPKTITNGALPIKLLYFKSSAVGEGILLEWASAEERDFDHYEIARSSDGKLFTSIAKVPGKSNDGAEYSFIDTAPELSTNYYKLMAVDVDGTREELKVIKGEWNGRRDWMMIYPNPVSDNIIHALFSESASGALRVLNSNGLTIAESLVTNASHSDLQLPAATTPGAYFVVAQMGERSAMIKVIVK